MRQSGETLVRSLSVAAGCMWACRPLHAIHLRALHHKYVLVRSTHWGGFVLAGYTHWGGIGSLSTRSLTVGEYPAPSTIEELPEAAGLLLGQN